MLVVLFWGVRTCITAPAEKPMAVAEKLIEAGREAGLTLINKGFSSNHGGVALIVQKDEKVANLVTVERTFEYEYRYSTTWWWSRKTLILKAAYRAPRGHQSGRARTSSDYHSPQETKAPLRQRAFMAS